MAVTVVFGTTSSSEGGTKSVWDKIGFRGNAFRLKAPVHRGSERMAVCVASVIFANSRHLSTSVALLRYWVHQPPFEPSPCLSASSVWREWLKSYACLEGHIRHVAIACVRSFPHPLLWLLFFYAINTINAKKCAKATLVLAGKKATTALTRRA